MDWSLYPNFREIEFRCRHTGLCEMDADFMARLQELRTAVGRPLVITSGYRHPTHPIEAQKRTSGAHTYGRAVDIAAHGPFALRLITTAIEFGFTGIGVAQKGDARFIHLDDLTAADNFPRPTIWSY
jgi:zinc D-Ala-D-Ala carboxypeptidase